METTVPLVIGLAAAMLLCMGALFDDRRARVRRRRQREEPVRALPLLHSINDDRCIGCEACVDVCPTEVLDLVDHKVRVQRFSDCVQCEQCANACPTQALVMYRLGTTPRVLTVPELDEHFQTGVPGQYLIGEVAGKPLVKNAANLGRAVVEHIVRNVAPRASGDDKLLDVLIVGSGPGGLSAGLTCLKHKLSCLVLEKEHVISATVSRYPKGKHFMAEPSTAKNVSYLPVFDGSKEELVAAWTQVIEGVQLPIRLGEAVESVKRGDDGVFTIKSTVGTYRARTVVLGTGLRGKPRLLVVPGANLEKVQSLLDDPAEFAGEDVLVVGGGDSAVEGAIALAEVGARVTLSYRGDGFKRCKQGNQKRLAEMTDGQRLTVLLESNVKCFTPDQVTITLADKSETTLANQRAFVLIGADTPVAWLEANNVRFVERPHLYALGSSEDVVRRFAPDAAPCPSTPAEALAIVLDRPLPRSPVQRVRSVAQHLREELWDVVTSVSTVFRLSELEPPRPGHRASTHRPPRSPAGLIPAARLAAGPPADGQHAAHAAPLRPRSPARRPGTVRSATVRDLPALPELTTQAVPSLRSLERAAGISRPIADKTDEMSALPHAFDHTTNEMTSLRARERMSQHLAAQGAIDGATDEVASLRQIERAATQRWAGTSAGDSATEQVPSLRTHVDMEAPAKPASSLPARERSTKSTHSSDARADATDQMHSLRPLEHRGVWTQPASDAITAATEEIPSLRTAESRIRPALPVSDAIAAAGEEVPSLHAIERRLGAELPPMNAAAPPAIPTVGTAVPPAPARLAVGTAPGETTGGSRPTPFPRTLRSATTSASSHAWPAADVERERGASRSSVITPAPRASTPVHHDARERGASGDDRSDAVLGVQRRDAVSSQRRVLRERRLEDPDGVDHPAAPDKTPTPMPRLAKRPTPSAVPVPCSPRSSISAPAPSRSAVPPPIPVRAPKLGRGSEAFATPPPSLASEPRRSDAGARGEAAAPAVPVPEPPTTPRDLP